VRGTRRAEVIIVRAAVRHRLDQYGYVKIGSTTKTRLGRNPIQIDNPKVPVHTQPRTVSGNIRIESEHEIVHERDNVRSPKEFPSEPSASQSTTDPLHRDSDQGTHLHTLQYHDTEHPQSTRPSSPRSVSNPIRVPLSSLL